MRKEAPVTEERRMKIIVLPILAVLAVATALPVDAQGQQPRCADRAKVVAMLAERYGEVLRWQGLQSDGRLLELFWSAGTGTWSAVISVPTGPGKAMSCMVAEGNAATERAAAEAGDPV